MNRHPKEIGKSHLLSLFDTKDPIWAITTIGFVRGRAISNFSTQGRFLHQAYAPKVRIIRPAAILKTHLCHYSSKLQQNRCIMRPRNPYHYRWEAHKRKL
ncbi:hypothetical protein ZeamMp144 (mitochondrion) [Zea mays subsp. mays]|uniref:Uncharacterized protein orf99-f n=1 Tax=Zea mays TaxID=4577 RepID=Q6R9B5_MAIZE|nr:hypothetical protein ZeamMp144 [Zea mays subsp. mays]AAR91186.1 hypothetical protein [Zea mays]WEB51514.1 hypothetical protein [Zea mays]WEB51674.1 hypothetical protein [Zea mays]|eukprot:YP_588393.1 hypothetical protein ZeamMp144 (mitochondrion) [Zea mays subsp. mays]